MEKVKEWKYKVKKKIGEGGYSEVYKCRDQNKNNNAGRNVAIKLVYTLNELEGVASFTIREVSLLKEMDHPNIVRLLDVRSSGKYVYLIFEYLHTDLNKFITTSPRTAKDSLLRKKFLQQILRGVAYCHAHKVLHRDLKPHNVLIDKGKSTVKLADFGLARTSDVPAEAYSVEVGTPMYKAPEILFGSSKYSAAIDMWSVGCIFGEMVKRKPIFPRKNAKDQLSFIFSILGTPTEETWPGVTSLCDFLPSFSEQKPKNLAEEFNNLEPAGVDLLSQMLCLDPSKRITADQALQHPYFEGH